MRNKPLLVYWSTLLCLFVGSVLLSSCLINGRPRQTTSEFVEGGSPQRGWDTLQTYGCPACHVIPGVPAPDSYVGPPLTHWPARSYIAGSLPNTPDNLVHWLQAPQTIEPNTAMPDLGLSEAEARDISAYLYSLER
ncbi:MAG: c-type cytochrome [Anaerolineales bacterium]|nr:c-type cytochrome [Anaerolineales bacterium]